MEDLNQGGGKRIINFTNIAQYMVKQNMCITWFTK